VVSIANAADQTKLEWLLFKIEVLDVQICLFIILPAGCAVEHYTCGCV